MEKHEKIFIFITGFVSIISFAFCVIGLENLKNEFGWIEALFITEVETYRYLINENNQ